MPAETRIGTPEEQHDDGIIDKAAILANFGSDVEVLAKLVELLLDDLPAMLSDIREAATSHDSQALGDSTHRLKGAASIFSPKASEMTEALELMGRSGNMADAEEAYAALEAEIEYLKLALAAFLEERASLGS